MARKTLNYTVQDEGRDKGKLFLLTELSAFRAEKWACRAFLALAHAGVEVPPGAAEAGIAGMAVMGLKALQRASFEEFEPLLDEMMACVQVLPDPANKAITRDVIEQDIEEVLTIWKLREAVFELHVGFSIAEALARSTLASATKSPA